MDKCTTCKGTGVVSQIYECHVCKGKKETDWVTNVMHHPEPIVRSSLDFIKIRTLLSQVENIAAIEPYNKVVERIKKYLKVTQDNHVIADWKVVSDETNNPSTRGNHRVDVYIQPSRSLEYVEINMEIMKGK